jgi:cysteinyl-tRNA synthetase
LLDLASHVRLGGSAAAEIASLFSGSLNLLGINPDGFQSGAVRRAVERAFQETGLPADLILERRIGSLLREREKARATRDFARADALRDRLVAAGIKVMDRAGADTEWELGPNFDATKLAEIEP